MPNVTSISYAADLVYQHDSDRFYTVLLAPHDRREALFSLYAFNDEISRVRDRVTEPLLGHIRLQWWRDHLKEICAGNFTPQHPILTPLAAAVHQYRLPFELFDALLSAHAQDLEEQLPENLIRYADERETPLIFLAAKILMPYTVLPADVFHHTGVACGLVSLLKDAKRSVVSADKVKETAETALKHISLARQFRHSMPRSVTAAFLPVCLAELSLNTLRKVGYDPAHPKFQQRHPWRSVALIWAAITGRW